MKTVEPFSRTKLLSARERREQFEKERVEKLRAGGENASNHQPMASSARRVSTVYSTAKSTASSKTLASVAKPKPAAAVVVAASGQEVADLKQQIAELKLQLSVESAAHRASEEEIQQHHLTIDALKTASQSDQSMISSQQSMISVLKQDLQLSAAKVETLGAQLLASSNTIAARERQIAALELSHQKSIAQLQQTLQQSQETAKEHEDHANELSKQLENSESNLMYHQQMLREAQQQLRDAEMLRRQLHNEMQELRGNIRVVTRIRPLLGDGAPADIVLGRDSRTLELSFAERRTNVHGEQQVGQACFQFDKCFGPSSTQEAVFEEISHAVQSVLDGYSSCIFSYGQTGCGKTYTMEGTESDPGVIPRSVRLIFDRIGSLAKLGWTYTMKFTFVEIYNETLRDLLTTEDSNKIKITHKSDGTTELTDARHVTVNNPSDIFAALKQAARVRATASTMSNERSSRSHSVFSLSVVGSNTVSRATSIGMLHLVDLAGSERLAVSKSEGQRLKETQAINKSLSALGDVIAALANGESFVPYRNSKLTFLLQNSLGGASSKTLMLVQISPSARDVGETLCSLKFASKVNSCEIGTAKKKTNKVELN